MSPSMVLKVTFPWSGLSDVFISGTLLTSAPVSLDDGLPRKRDTVAAFCVFLQPDGIINHFSIPFHALTTSSTAERDFQLQATLQVKIQKSKVETIHVLEKRTSFDNMFSGNDGGWSYG